MKKLLLISVLTIYTSSSFAQGTQLKPFKIVVYDQDYSTAYTLQYILTEKDIKILHKGELVGEKDSVLFRTVLSPSATLGRISDINMDSLKEYYYNPCIEDGSQITVIVSKSNKTKSVHLSNYYQPDIGAAIELINGTLPQTYKIHYDKKALLQRMKDCK